MPRRASKWANDCDNYCGVWVDYFAIDLQTRCSSSMYTGSTGPYHVPVISGDRLVWAVDIWEGATSFRVCGYTPDEEGFPT